MKRRVPCEVYSRVVGYLRPVKFWNKAKQQEWAELCDDLKDWFDREAEANWNDLED